VYLQRPIQPPCPPGRAQPQSRGLAHLHPTGFVQRRDQLPSQVLFSQKHWWRQLQARHGWQLLPQFYHRLRLWRRPGSHTPATSHTALPTLTVGFQVCYVLSPVLSPPHYQEKHFPSSFLPYWGLGMGP
jgi:hypothetical protein